MKTIGIPLYGTTPKIDETNALQQICRRYTGTAKIVVRDTELNPQLAAEVAQIGEHGGDFIRIVADGPDEAQLVAAIHQQLVKDKYCY